MVTPTAASASDSSANGRTPAMAANPRRGEEAQPAEHDQRGAPEAGADEERPEARHDGHQRPFLAPCAGGGRGRAEERGAEEHHHGGPHQQGQQVIAHRDAAEIDDQQDDPEACSLPADRAPAEAEPADEGDGERRDAVDLGLVAVLPLGEGEGGEEPGCGAATDTHQPSRRGGQVAGGTPQRFVPHEEEAAGRERAEDGAHQVGAPRVLPDRQQGRPDVAEQHEEGGARRMRDAEVVHRCDQLAGIPERHAGRQGEDIPASTSRKRPKAAGYGGRGVSSVSQGCAPSAWATARASRTAAGSWTRKRRAPRA